MVTKNPRSLEIPGVLTSTSILLPTATAINSICRRRTQKRTWVFVKPQFHIYVNKMIEKGYWVWSKGNCYDFYEEPKPTLQAEPQPQEPEESVF